MTISWPRQADGLPPGQRLMNHMPRFTDLPHRAPPEMPHDPHLDITKDGVIIGQLGAAELEALGPSDHRADFHCVTTWSVTGLIWTGVPLHRALASVGISDAPSDYLVARAGDHRRATFVWDDAIADDVLLATHLNGELLGHRHGGPLRLVAPRQYGYKSVKHLIGIDFRSNAPQSMSKEHLRGRVALEERHPKLPNWLIRMPYRLLIPPTAFIAERSLRRHHAQTKRLSR